MKNMSNKAITISGIVAIVIVMVMSVIVMRNGFVSAEEDVNTKMSNIEVQYQRRTDLINNLLNTAKGSVKMESEAIQKIIDSRNNARPVAQSGEIDDRLQGVQKQAVADNKALGAINVLVERYPELKSASNFKDLMVQLEGTENRIQHARNKYNDSVRYFNGKVRRFPGNMVAGMFGFDKFEYFEADEGADKAPVINEDSFN